MMYARLLTASLSTHTSAIKLMYFQFIGCLQINAAQSSDEQG